MNQATVTLRAARDALLAVQGHHEKALAEFRWPDVGDLFSWAHDWFDAFARGYDGLGLVIVEESGALTSYTFDELSRASAQRPTGWPASECSGGIPY